MLLRPTLNSENVFKVSFDNNESLNLKNALNGEITLSNPALCYYIESELPKRFEECKNKGVTVTEIINGLTIIATVIVMDLDFNFGKPSSKALDLSFTKVTFENEEYFKAWEKDKDYFSKRLKTEDNTYKVLLLNVETFDEMQLSEYHAIIENKFALRNTISNFIKELKRMFNV